MKSPIDILGRAACAVFLALASTPAFAAQQHAPAAAPQAPDDFRHQLAHDLQKSDSPRDWALGSQLLETRPATGANLHERLVSLQRAGHEAPDDRLVQALWMNARCRARQGCGDHALLARLDPDNAATWVAVVDGAWKAGNGRVVDDAIARMASSGRYNEHLGQAIGAWRDLFQRNPPPDRGGADTTAQDGYVLKLALDEAIVTAIPPTDSLVDACAKSRHPEIGPRRFETCGRIGRLMMGRAQTLQGRMAGVAVLRASRAGTKADVERIRTVTWQAEQMATIDAALGNDPVTRQNYMNLIQANDSEMAALRFELTIFGAAMTPPDDWKQTVDGHPVEPLDEAMEPAH